MPPQNNACIITTSQHHTRGIPEHMLSFFLFCLNAKQRKRTPSPQPMMDTNEKKRGKKNSMTRRFLVCFLTCWCSVGLGDEPPTISAVPQAILAHRGPLDAPAIEIRSPLQAVDNVQIKENYDSSTRANGEFYQATVPHAKVRSDDWVDQLVAKLRTQYEGPPMAEPGENRPEVLSALVAFKTAQQREKILHAVLAQAEKDTKTLEMKYIDVRDCAVKKQRDEEASLLRARNGVVPAPKGDSHLWTPWGK